MTEPARVDMGSRRGHPPPRPAALGFTLLEMLAVLALAALMMAGLVTMIGSSLEDTRGQQAALYQSQLTTAATRLIEQNYAALVAQATASTPVVVKLNGGAYALSSFLPSAVGATNPYGQTPCLLIYGTGGGTAALQALLVTEGGSTIPDPELGYIAANAGAGGGSIQATNNANGAANGAYGSWKVVPPNPAGASCTGKKTGTGHLASLIYYDGTQAQNADYLYRVAVPGNPQANTMQVPIVLSRQQDYRPCSQPGAIAADSLGNVLNCDATQNAWVPQASYHWREPVVNEAALASVAAPQKGDVRITQATYRAYTYNGNTWQPLAVDESGNLALGNAQTVGAPCPSAPSNSAIAPASASTTLVSTDASGRVLSCRNGSWQTQSEIEPASALTGCQIVMANSNGGAGDYSSCSGQPATNFNSGAYSYNGSNGTYSYTYTTTVNLTKPGIIVAATWAHLNDGLCNGPYGHRAQLSQSVDIKDGNDKNVAHTESQTPTLQDDSGGINNALAQAGTPGTYTVVVTTNWATYAGITTPWVSNFCGQSGTIQNTPIAAGWTINSYY